MKVIGNAAALAAAVVCALLFAAPASAATCSDYETQAAAQRAADTLDADGDGLYCEALPCPCLKPGQPSRPKEPSRPSKPARPKPKPKAKKRAKAKPLVGRAQIVDAPAPGVYAVEIARTGRSSGLRRRETVRLIGLTPPAAGRCGHKEALAATLDLAFGTEARDSDGDGLVDLAPTNAREVGPLVDVRTDVKVKPVRDLQGRLRAYLDAGHTGTDLGRELIASGWAAAGYGDYTRSQRLLAAQDRAERGSLGAWLLCHADFERPAAERFDGFTACPDGLNPDGSPFEGPGGFIRNIIVAGGDCESAYAAIAAWTPMPRVDMEGPAQERDAATLADGSVCDWVIHRGQDNPAIEVTCRTAAGVTAVAWAAP
ncbi:hypothetical protein DVA67_012775 [Solirubrobacter sp. CPCC 204708]|uniref:TNase-like domain-containing protein n=1 Tax=Solirubrobacter deserti TaxID=2282478 RepID=A0ABT4RK50_9ACTN|nr:hypothetical protein [Solirubrobacter deserti]MBE2316849.1 hypothetical protein [Solirubrobacter deserti]MDA0138934.1 hypothetical protein [Solirubrobacter deserti]